MKNQCTLSLFVPLAFALLFTLAAPMQGWCTETVLQQFSGPNGATPYAGLISDSAGNLYGTTSAGGAYNAGVVFELVNSAGSYSETLLHSFTGGSDGGSPTAALVMDASGNLYGTAEEGGTGSCSSTGCGVVFELVKSSVYSETVLHRFTGAGDGGLPVASLVFDTSGDLYGTAMCGGVGTCSGGSGGYGVVFELIKSEGYTEVVLHGFAGGADGGVPTASVILDASSNVFGTTEVGGMGSCSTGGCGVVFELVKSSGYADAVLHRFTGGADGGRPRGGVTADSSGNLYGTATCGGSAACAGGSGGDGVVFEIAKSTGGLTALHTFAGSDGAIPIAGPVYDPVSGYLIGTTFAGGAYGYGTVYEMLPTGATFNTEWNFTGGTDGGHPVSTIGMCENVALCHGRCIGVTPLTGAEFNVGAADAISFNPLL